ncbi:calpain-8-like [Gigantopelta aegis]|uniref:calpain-8-like n=1 Tax=Gigantopelta aegis TaxID=1735272 RepID=UPI001B88A450|nr:calpain-8-like [Gigantopelta aegis]
MNRHPHLSHPRISNRSWRETGDNRRQGRRRRLGQKSQLRSHDVPDSGQEATTPAISARDTAVTFCLSPPRRNRWSSRASRSRSSRLKMRYRGNRSGRTRHQHWRPTRGGAATSAETTGATSADKDKVPSTREASPEISDNAKFIVDGATYYDIQQNGLGDCWFVAAAVTLAASPSNRKLFERVVPLNQSFDHNYAGIFRFHFWQYGEWKEVVVDDRLPTRHGKLIYAANRKETNEFWCPLLEKAYAKLYGCYEAIDGGWIHDALVDMTGGISELIEMQEGISLDELRTTLFSKEKMNTLMGGAIDNKPGSRHREAQRKNGLIEGHAYSIVDIREINQGGKSTTLLRLRNPWGRGEWNGPWSDGFGLFGQAFEPFLNRKGRQFFQSPFIGRPDDEKPWPGSFWMNPQYKVHLDKADRRISVIVNLMEVSDRRVRDEFAVYIGFVIFKLRKGRKPLRLSGDNFYKFMPEVVKTSGTFVPYREITMRFELEPSTYILVPCTSEASMEADFYLRVMTEKPTRVERVYPP